MRTLPDIDADGDCRRRRARVHVGPGTPDAPDTGAFPGAVAVFILFSYYASSVIRLRPLNHAV
jgi:hypothetical protein